MVKKYQKYPLGREKFKREGSKQWLPFQRLPDGPKGWSSFAFMCMHFIGNNMAQEQPTNSEYSTGKCTFDLPSQMNTRLHSLPIQTNIPSAQLSH